MGKYAEMSKLILQHMGGVGNITHVTHCATRLRIDYADKKLVDAGALKELPEAAGEFLLHRTYRYGKAKITTYRKRQEEE